MTLSYLRHVDRLTRVKERAAAEGVLVEALADLFAPDAVVFFEVAGPADDVRCLERLEWRKGYAALKATGAWAAWDAALPLASLLGAQGCLDSGVPQWLALAQGGALLLPIRNDNGERRLIRLAFAHPIETQAMLLAEAVVGIYRNFLDLLDYSERDTLTGLLNRKSFDETFMKAARHVPVSPAEDEVQSSGVRQAMERASFWLGVVDVDHFKRVNDGFGHLIGDEVLLLLAGVMRNTFRHDDRLYRFGGEEFVVLLRAAEAAQAEWAFERFRHNIQTQAFPQVGHITVSIGYTHLNANDTPAAAFERADKVVYLAKSNGRNQVQSYEAALASGRIVRVDVGSDLEEF
jgi:diguanylate cyclase (GGDEF)-like protein